MSEAEKMRNTVRKAKGNISNLPKSMQKLVNKCNPDSESDGKIGMDAEFGNPDPSCTGRLSTHLDMCEEFGYPSK